MNRLAHGLSLLTLAVSLVANPAFAVTHVITTASAKDFLAGDALGTGIGADGRLALGLAFAPRAWPDDAADAVVFAAASDGSGRVYVATGGGLGRLFGTGADGKVSLLFTAPEANVTTVVVAPDGAVICGTSPNGKLYRVDPKEKSGKEIGDPKEAAIWALAFGPDGTLYAGTGNKGRIYRRTAAGAVELFYTAEDTHIRCLTTGKDGTVYAGTSEKGLVLAIGKNGVARTLHDFTRPEVVSLLALPDGTVFAAATSAEPPPVVPASAEPKLRAPAAPTPTAAGTHEEVPRGTVSVSVSTGPIRIAPSSQVREGSGEVVQISPDGFVEPAWTFTEETIYSMRLDPKTGELVFATGPRGRLYAWKERHLRLIGQTEQKQVVAAPPGPSGPVAVTMNTPGVFVPTNATPARGSYISVAKDAGRLAKFGRLHFEGSVPPGSSVSFSARAGNSEKPDGSWAPWTPLLADGGSGLPYARFFQWKAELTASPKGESPVLEKVDFSYVERNARPVLENVTVLEPGAVYSKSGSSGTAVLSVTNPDENGIYAGLEAPRDGLEPPLGKKLYRKGYRTLTWKGADPNGDALRYDLEARREGESAWFPIRKDLEDAYYSFDTTALQDGRYRFRVTASDRVSNPEGQALTATEESALALVDNTPPNLRVDSAAIDGSEIVLLVTASDALSPIVKAEGSVNADRWRVLVSEEGGGEALTEHLVFRVAKPSGAAVVSIRVLDAGGNTAAIAVEYPKGFR